ncbi:MAG: hypothetical protein AABZ06_12435 [Bdellovibrionota bacterium]
MKTMNTELKKVVSRVKMAQEKLQGIMKNQGWVEDAKKYAERQGREVKKLFTADVEKVKTFLLRERKYLDKIQKHIPGEVRKFGVFVKTQKKEFERLLTGLRKARTNGKLLVKGKAKGRKAVKVSVKAKTTKSKTARKSTTAASA